MRLVGLSLGLTRFLALLAAVQAIAGVCIDRGGGSRGLVARVDRGKRQGFKVPGCRCNCRQIRVRHFWGNAACL